MGNNSIWRKGKREKGICGADGCWEVSGDEYRCLGCRKQHAEDERVRYYARKLKAAAQAA